MKRAQTKKRTTRRAKVGREVNTAGHRMSALRPATPLQVMIRRALDQELEWYHSYAEGALRRASLPILPAYAVVGTEPTDDALRARAAGIAEAVRRGLVALRGNHAEVLRAAYTPRSWPRPLTKAFGPVAPIAVRIAFAADPWPERHSREGVERAAAARLSAAVVSESVRVGRLRSQAERLLGGAIVAYAKVRDLTPSALGLPATRSR